MISFKNITKQYQEATTALDNITMDIPARQLTVIIGPSGCGKTTLMKMINRLETPTNGDIYIDDANIANQDPVALRRSIGYVIQRIGLIPHMTIGQNVALVPSLLGWSKQKQTERVHELLELVDLNPEVYKDRYPVELSGGQQQRVGVSRALASDPNIILMDEPFSALDPISREQLQYELKLLQKKIQKTIVFVTHDMDEALDIADEIILMRDGEIEQKAHPDELLNNPANDFVKDFIGVKRIERKRQFAEKSLLTFKSLFKVNSEMAVQSVAPETTMREAKEILDKQKDIDLKITEGNQVLGYVDYQVILEAAMNGSDQID